MRAFPSSGSGLDRKGLAILSQADFTVLGNQFARYDTKLRLLTRLYDISHAIATGRNFGDGNILLDAAQIEISLVIRRAAKLELQFITGPHRVVWNTQPHVAGE